MKTILLILITLTFSGFKTHSEFDFESKLVLSIITDTHIIDNELNDKVIITMNDTVINLKKDYVSNWFLTTKYLNHYTARITEYPDRPNKVLTTCDKNGNKIEYEISINLNNGFICDIILNNVSYKY